jgi:hypothetical protein
MRFPTIKSDFWELRSAEESHLKNPKGFWIPALVERQNVRRGQAVRLIFDIEVENEDGELEISGERMWVLLCNGKVFNQNRELARAPAFSFI